MLYPAEATRHFQASEKLENTLVEHFIYRNAALYGSKLLWILAELRRLYAIKAPIKDVPSMNPELFDLDLEVARLQDEDELILFYDEFGDIDFSIDHLYRDPNIKYKAWWRTYGRYHEQWHSQIYRGALKESFPYLMACVYTKENENETN